MTTKKPFTAFLLGLAALLSLATSAAYADITTEQKISVTGMGGMSFMDMNGTTKTSISGTKSRSDTQLEMQSKLVKFFARNATGPSAEIVLLDADKLYHLNMNKKEYTEQSFEDLKAQLQKVMNGNAGNDKPDAKQPSAIDDSKCEYQEPKSDVKRTGEKSTIAGFQAEHVIITAEQPCKDKETGAICEIALTIDQWLAPTFGTNAEIQKYSKAYAQKMGLDPNAIGQSVNDRAKAMFSRYKGVWEQVSTKMRGIKGYPVKSSFGLGVGGDQCKQAQTAQQQQSSGGDSEDSSSSGGLAGKAVSKLGSLFHKKKDDSAQTGDKPAEAAATPPPAVTGPSGTITVMTVSSELVSVSMSPVPAEVFTVPADFKKVEAPHAGS